MALARAWERRGTRAPDETRMGEARAMRPAMASAGRGWLCGDRRQNKVRGLVFLTKVRVREPFNGFVNQSMY